MDLNQQSYQRLKSALALNLRRQIFIGICDDLHLRDRLVHRLEEELSGSTAGRGRYQPYPYLVSLQLSLNNPDPIAQISQWLEQNPPPSRQHRHAPTPAFQLTGVEHLSRQDASLQWLFLSHLRGIERSMPALESTLLLWVTRPWSRMIPQAAPTFWRCRTAIFDFIGEPTPSISQPETFPIAVKPIERSPSSALPADAPQESPDNTDSPPISHLDLASSVQAEFDSKQVSDAEGLLADESIDESTSDTRANFLAPDPSSAPVSPVSESSGDVPLQNESGQSDGLQNDSLDVAAQDSNQDDIQTEKDNVSGLDVSNPDERTHGEIQTDGIPEDGIQNDKSQDDEFQNSVHNEASQSASEPYNLERQESIQNPIDEDIQNDPVQDEAVRDDFETQNASLHGSFAPDESVQVDSLQNESAQDKLAQSDFQSESTQDEIQDDIQNEFSSGESQQDSVVRDDIENAIQDESVREDLVQEDSEQDEVLKNIQDEATENESDQENTALDDLEPENSDQDESVQNTAQDPIQDDADQVAASPRNLGQGRIFQDETIQADSWDDAVQDDTQSNLDLDPIQDTIQDEATQDEAVQDTFRPHELRDHIQEEPTQNGSDPASSILSPHRHSTPDMPLPPCETDINSIEQMIIQAEAEAAIASTGVMLDQRSDRSSLLSPSLTLPFLAGLGNTAPAQNEDDELNALQAKLRNPGKTLLGISEEQLKSSTQDSLQPGASDRSSHGLPNPDGAAQDSSESSGMTTTEGVWLDEEIAQAFQGNLEQEDPQAFAALQQIERLREQQAPISVIAGSYRGLGNLYRNRIEQGDISPQNLMRAMKAYEQVLQFVRDSSPIWSEVLNDMGNLCWLLSRCAPVPEQGLPHLQQGIQAYQMALGKINPHTHPQTYPMIQNNLGAAYGDLARHQNAVENLQKSLDAYQEALRYRKSELDPTRYASTQNNLGTTYWNLAQYRDPKPNLKQAIASYTEALHYYQPDQDAINYAMIQNNLGTAYWNLSQHERSDRWLRLAIDAYTNALQYRTLEANPVAYAATQNNLGTAYWHLSSHYEPQPELRINCLEQAITAYEQALYAVDQIQQGERPTPLNFDVLATRNNLGLVLFQLATDGDRVDLEEPSPEQNDILDRALNHHLAALDGWQSRSDLRQTALTCIVQTLKMIHNQQGMAGQSLALSKIPVHVLSEILPQL